MVLSTLSFAIMAVCVRKSGDLPLFEKVFFRNFIMLFIVIFLIWRSDINWLGEPRNRKFLAARALLGFTGVCLFFYAILNINLSDASVLNKLSPFFVFIFAVLFLKEKLGRFRIPALVIAFIGSIMVIQPRFDVSVLPAAAGAASALTAGLAYTIVRYLGDKEHPYTIIFYFSCIATLISLPLMLLDFVRPNMEQLLFLLLTGVFAAGGQYLLTLAYKHAKASEISVYNYSHVVWAFIIGLLFFGEIPNMIAIIGTLLIVGTGVALWTYDRRTAYLNN